MYFMNPHNEKLKKEIQKIIYQELEIWKQQINDLEAKKINKNTFKQHYVEFLQKIEENIAHFTEFYLKKQSHAVANQILEDNLEKTAMLETINQFLSEPQKEIEIQEEIVKEIEMEMDGKNEIIHRKFASTLKKEKPLVYRASEVEYIN